MMPPPKTQIEKKAVALAAKPAPKKDVEAKDPARS
jgi:hypothetical protein